MVTSVTSLSSAQKLHSLGVMCQMCGELLNQNSILQIILMFEEFSMFRSKEFVFH